MKPHVLVTKLNPPAANPKGVQRKRLIEQLNQGLEAGRRLTLVSAPAGFGKSSCISEWIRQLALPVAWLSLDAADDDHAWFFTYLVAALQKIDEKLGRELDSILESGQDPPAQAICTALLDDLEVFEGRFLLVLDDFHVIQERATLDVLEILVTNIPPQLHLVIVTREDPPIPLARLRANNQMTEIRAEQLRFNSLEAASFFNKTMDLTLSSQDLEVLESRIEGWVAGLQLAGLSIQGRADPSSFIAALSGTHRHILSYLTEEVLNRQSEEIQNFLVQTSILARLSGDLCDAVTGRTDCRTLLEHLFKANLFLIPLDDEQHWYRYHHLFADLIRSQQNRIPKEQVIRLHRNASLWFDEAGMEAEAIDHALAGEDYPRATVLLERHAMSFVTQGYVKTVEGWMRAIPSGWNSQSPLAYLAFASVYLMRGNYAGVSKSLSQAEAAIFQIPPANQELVETNAMRAEWYSIKANLLNVQGKPVESLEAATLALRFTQPGDFYTRGIAYLGLGGAYRLTGDYDQLVGAYQQAIQNSRAAGNSLAEMLAANALGLMAIQHGQLHFAYQVGTEAIDRFERPGTRPPPIAGSVYGVLGLVEYEWNRLENARKHLTQGLQLIILGGHNAGVVFAKIIMARVLQSEGDLPGSARMTQEAADLLPFGVPTWLKPEVVAQQVRIYLAQNNPVSAEAVLKQYRGSGEGPEANLDEPVLLSQLHLALYLAQAGAPLEGLQQAAELVNHILAATLDSGRTGNALQALLVRAKIHERLGNKDASLQDLGKALQLSGSEGYVRTFIDEGPEIAGLLKGCLKQNIAPDIVRRLLAAFPVSESGTTPDSSGMIEPLSERERQVLGLMAEGLTNPEIANRLIISVSTVKTHLVNIYGKMNVRNRAEAVSRGKELGLL